MTTYFFPSCKVSGDYPQASRQLAEYLQSHTKVLPAGCCRNPSLSLSPEDRAAVICHTCANITEERFFPKDPARVSYVWELLDRDEDFPFPDYQGEKITVQDCLLAAERPAGAKAVRSLLGKLNFQVLEPPDTGEEPFRCRMLLEECSAANRSLAPRHYGPAEGGKSAGLFLPMSPAEQDKRFREHCALITTERVVCYCRSCVDSINRGGKRAVHILELLFPN